MGTFSLTQDTLTTIFEGREYDCKVDVWALGCIVYEMVERKRAFPGTQELAVFHKICQGIVTYPEHSKLNDLVKKLLTKSIDIRPSSSGLFSSKINVS
jgi:serine/threonine protein kinase